MKKDIKAEAFKVIGPFYQNPKTKIRTTHEIARQVLLNGPYIIMGSLRDIKARHLGLGVCELFIDIKEKKL